MTQTLERHKQIRLLGFIKIGLEIVVKTGLHIGGSADSIDKGGIDSPVIKNPVTNEPYIPGSSLRGRMRSLLEKKGGRNIKPMTKTDVVWMEIYPEKEYPGQSTMLAQASEVCRVFGDSSCEQNVPSVLIVNDAMYTEAIKNNTKFIKDGLPVTEAKLEIAVDRITAHAVPRTIERVPEGAVFETNLIYKVQTYEDGAFLADCSSPQQKGDKALEKDIENILDALVMIQEFEGLGGKTSRGSGRVAFNFTSLQIKRYRKDDSQIDLHELKSETDKRRQIIQEVKGRPFSQCVTIDSTGVV